MQDTGIEENEDVEFHVATIHFLSLTHSFPSCGRKRHFHSEHRKTLSFSEFPKGFGGRLWGPALALEIKFLYKWSKKNKTVCVQHVLSDNHEGARRMDPERET